MTTALEAYRPLFMVVTFGFLAVAFYLTYRPRRVAATRAPSRVLLMNKIMLWAATVVAAFVLFFPQQLTTLTSADDQFTADMNRTVLTVDGLTCPG